MVLGESSGRNAFSDAASEGGLFPAPLGGVVDRASDWGGTLSYLDYGSPVFEVFNAPHSGDFSAAKFFRYRAFEAPVSEGVLARYDDGVPGARRAEARLGSGADLDLDSGHVLERSREAAGVPPVHASTREARRVLRGSELLAHGRGGARRRPLSRDGARRRIARRISRPRVRPRHHLALGAEDHSFQDGRARAPAPRRTRLLRRPARGDRGRRRRPRASP